MTPQEALEKAIKIVGGKVVLADILEITPQALGQWKVCPPERVLAVENAVRDALKRQRRITRHHLRPDLYGRGP